MAGTHVPGIRNRRTHCSSFPSRDRQPASSGMRCLLPLRRPCRAARMQSNARIHVVLDPIQHAVDDIPTLRRILNDNRVIAMVGLSANWYRPSYFAAKYMLDRGYRVIPVNPSYEEVLGQKCYARLRDIP